jgi:hypothetical protein
MSGGLRWQEDNNVSGDIVPPPELKFPFSVECKKREIDWDFDFILKGTSPIWDFYKQSCRDSSRYIDKGVKREPMVVFSKNRRESYVMIHKDIFDFLFKDKEVEYLEIYYYAECHVVIMSFEKFLDSCTLEEVLSIREIL